MKRFFSIPFLTAATVAVTSSANAATYNFESGYIGGELNGQNGWSVDSATPQAASVIALGGVWGTRAGALGFVAPLDQDNVYASQGSSTPMVGATFSVMFQVQDSDTFYGPGAEVRDTFGFRLENSTGDNLFSLYLTPFDQDPTPETDTAFHTFSWSTGVGLPTMVLDDPLVAAQELFAYTFTIDFFDAGLGDVGFNADFNGSGFSGTISGLSGETISEFGAFWNTTEGAADPGSNFLIFDNVNLIPEPSSSLLLCLAGLGFVTRRKRA